MLSMACSCILCFLVVLFFFKQKTEYEMRISDWSSDVCSSDLGGFQEVDQMPMFREMVCYQEEVRDPARIAEVLNRVIEKAWRGSAPAQINVPRDYWTQVIDIELPQRVRFERPAGGRAADRRSAE